MMQARAFMLQSSQQVGHLDNNRWHRQKTSTGQILLELLAHVREGETLRRGASED